MPDLPTSTASNMDEFNEQARSFMTKAKSNGASNTAIANTIKLMFGLYQQKQSEIQDQPDENWLYRDMDGDGIDDVMYNTKTGEERPVDYGYGNDGLGELEAEFGTESVAITEDYAKDMPAQTDIPRRATTAPGETGYDVGRSTELGEQVWSSSELERLEQEQDFSAPMSMAQPGQQSTSEPEKESWTSGFGWNQPLFPAIGKFFKSWGEAAEEDRSRQLTSTFRGGS